MTNKLISLALLVFFLTTSYGNSENQFLFPKKKPSVFKKIEKTVKSENLNQLPQKKPIIQTELKQDKKVKTKQSEIKEIDIKKKITKHKKRDCKKIKSRYFFITSKKTYYI